MEATDQNVSPPQNLARGGHFGCPICGDHDGDHHLVRCEEIAVQVSDWAAVLIRRLGL